MKRSLLLAAALVATPWALAHADIIPVENSISGSGPYTWSYNATVTVDETAKAGPAPSANPVPLSSAGAFFTIYDFAGFVPGSCTSPSGWSCSVQNVGYTPIDTNPTDNSGIVNLTWSYNTGSDIVGSNNALTGFSAQSTDNQSIAGQFTARATKNTGDQAGTTVDNIGSVIVPTGSKGVPEPTPLALLGFAALGFVTLRRKLSF